MRNKYFKAILFIAFIFSVNVTFAQGPPPPPPLPIDGGIVGLFVIAIGYAIKKIHSNSKK
jgi:hypothetical protein